MIIDCDSCAARPTACADCVVGVLLGGEPPSEVTDGEQQTPPSALTLSLDAPERRALDVLAEQGLVPRLRLVAPAPRRTHSGRQGEDVGRDVG